MRTAIIGATGMLGHHAARAAQAAGHELIVVYRSEASRARLGALNATFRRADLADRASLQQALQGVDAVLNAAAYYPTVPRPWRDEVATALGLMQNFYDAADAAGVPRVVYLGGAIALPRHADGRPADGSERYAAPPRTRNPYVQVKWALDEQALGMAAQGRPVWIGIPSMTFGEYDYGPTTGQLITGIASGQLTRYVRGRRNVVYAGDAGRGLVRAMERGEPGQRYLITGENTSMDALTALVAQRAERPAPKASPLALARGLSALQTMRYRWLKGPPPTISATAIAVMAAGQHLDGRRSREALGYAPEVSLQDTVQRTLDWFRAEGMC